MFTMLCTNSKMHLVGLPIFPVARKITLGTLSALILWQIDVLIARSRTTVQNYVTNPCLFLHDFVIPG